MNEHDQHYSYEEDFYSKDRKFFRKERKMASAKDRSKFKKSDQDQLKKRSSSIERECNDNDLRGRVLAITPEGIVVDNQHSLYTCQLKGSLKQETNRFKNLVAVGDFVYFAPQSDDEGTISFIEERRSILSRADNLSRNKEQLIAVNIDQVLITASVILPPLKPFLIDRYIIAARKGNMEPIIVINKTDYLESTPSTMDQPFFEEEKRLYHEFLEIYRNLGITVLPVSSNTGEGIEALKQSMKGKASVFSGQSGVGKSSLMNAVTGSNLRVGGIVDKTRKGSHTTTSSHLLPTEDGGFCIDTPGIKSFGIWELSKQEIQSHFSEIGACSQNCKYPDCLHLQEPVCAVKDAVENGHISRLRFDSYCALMASLSKEHRHR
ncbi:MAG TPA: ribosome small subunit-dependent GTPase A [Rhabdochlamydiaceae bacterium]|nr:ribosome small subunit-dependent GTPase A [Rhabdochlamydiaceae bacterium]